MAQNNTSLLRTKKMLEEDVIRFHDQALECQHELSNIKKKYNNLEKIANESFKLNRTRNRVIEQIKGIVCRIGNSSARGVTSKRKGRKKLKRRKTKGRKKPKGRKKSKGRKKTKRNKKRR